MVKWKKILGATNVDWTNTNLQPIPDSLPTVYSSEDWQAAFGFQTEPRQLHALSKSSPEPSASVPFDNKNLADEESFSSSQFNPPITDNATSSILNNSPATKFMADFQQNSLQQRLALQVTVRFLYTYFFRRKCSYLVLIL